MTRVLSLLSIVALAYIGLCTWLYVNQRKMLFQPTRLPISVLPHQAHLAFDGRALVFDPPGTARATAIVYHGNAGYAGDRLSYVHALGQLGVRVVLAEYPGYGWRSGQPSEKSLVDDGLKLYDAVCASMSSGQPLLLLGESLGSGVAVQIAAEAKTPPERLILITPFSSLMEVAQKHFPWLPARWLVRDPFRSERYLPKYKGYVILVIAGQDEVVGPEIGRELSEAVSSESHARVIELAGAHHNDWMMATPAGFWQEVAELR